MFLIHTVNLYDCLIDIHEYFNSKIPVKNYLIRITASSTIAAIISLPTAVRCSPSL